ncbi:MAG: hypothetical protein ACQGVC_14900 [Myxococcota bacterium]
MGDAPYLRDERVVAASPTPREGAPEYRMRAVLRREFHADAPSVRLVVEGPFAEAVEYWDAHQVELLIALLQRALPALREAEARIEDEWQRWRDRTSPPADGC